MSDKSVDKDGRDTQGHDVPVGQAGLSGACAMSGHDKPAPFRGRPMLRQHKAVRLDPPYLNVLSPSKAEALSRDIADLLIVKRKFRDKELSAKGVAVMLGTNTRYVSITMQLRFHMNFSSFVNKLRVEDAMSMLADPRCEQLSIHDIYDMAGFSNRQCFITAFQKFCGMTPSQYRRTKTQPGDVRI